MLAAVLDGLERGAAERGGPVPAGDPRRLAARWEAALGTVLPEEGAGAEDALHDVARVLAAGAADPADPLCAGHLHCPPLAVAVAADTAASIVNPSLDSWDQAPAAMTVEARVIEALAGLAGYDPESCGGVFTTGGTESNMMGLLLARDHAVARHLGVDAARAGLPIGGRRLRVLCSEAAHFSVARCAGFLGLGEEAVIAVPADPVHRMDVAALRAELDRVWSRGEIPAAIVGTAGTTDLGAIDPLPGLAEAAAAYGTWLHVDASYGAGALFSDRLRPLLDGLPRADSLALDLHKMGWQPVAAGVFLTADGGSFGPLSRQVAYLNPADDEEEGYISLLGRSMRTTRRPDAVKVAATLRALGRRGLGAMADHCHDLARYAATRIAAHPRLELYAEPVLSTVVFRHMGSDELNAALRRRLLAEGRAVIGRTDVAGSVHLKLTLLNPAADESDVDRLIAAAGGVS